MSSDDQSGINQSSIDQPSVDQSSSLPSSSSVPDNGKHIKRIVDGRGLRTFLIVDYTANLRKNSKISAIWRHGGERRRLDDNNIKRYWRCTYCIDSTTILKIDRNKGQTTYALQHFKNKHNIDCKADNEVIPSSIAAFLVTASADALAVVIIATKAVREAYKLIIIYDAAKFRQALIIFIIICNIAFSIVEFLYF
jgi:hypothetical protein